MTRSDDGDAVKRLVQQHWDRRAATFDDESQHGIHTDEQHDRWLTVLDEWTGDAPRTVLDAGCGTGVVSSLLAELGHEVSGVDVAPGMLAEARRKTSRTALPVEFFRGDAETLPVASDGVELLTARHLVWTLPDPEAAIREWQRVVEPGGTILLIEGYWDHDEPWDEYREMHGDLPMYDGKRPEALRTVFERHGLGAVEYEPLMDPILWGREPQYEYYVLTGTVTG